MALLADRFAALGADNAPGQEVRQQTGHLEALLRGDRIDGVPVDFSHGDVDAFAPTPGAEASWNAGFARGGAQAYTEYRGDATIRAGLADRLTAFTGAPISAEQELIITPGTQGALFLALGALVDQGTKVAVVDPDYFANRKLVAFFGGEVVPIPLRYGADTPDQNGADQNGPDLEQLQQAFESGTRVLVFSTPNNPTGYVCSAQVIAAIASLAARYDVAVVVDQLYSRMLYRGESYSHLRALPDGPKTLVTIMGPSKTESLSGFRLGVAFGSADIIARMEQLQAIVSLRAAGYNQAALETWFCEPEGWLQQRIAQHEAIRDDLLAVFRGAGLACAAPQAGSYLFPKLPSLAVSYADFVRLLRHQAGVTVTPGAEFGSSCDDSIRLNFSQDHAAAVAAAQRIVGMVERYRA